LSQRLRIELDDLRERYGVEPSIEEVLWLSKACDRCDNPYTHERIDLMDIPCPVGGVHVWPLTIGAACWLDAYASAWWGKSDELYFWALAYALVNARDSNAFRHMTDEQTAGEAVKECALRFAVNREELEAAIDFVLGKPFETVPDEKQLAEAKAKMDWARLVQEIETSTGITADIWLWGKSAAYTAQAYCRHREISIALAGGKMRRTRDAMDDAVNNLARVKKAICASRNGGANE